jgi:hypothetical protein
MSNRTLFDHRGSVVKEIITHEHEDDDTLHIRTAQDIAPVLDLVDRLADMHHVVGHRKSQQMVPVAEVPMVIYEQAMREGWAEDPAAWKRWLNDKQNEPFRITKGRV